MANDDLFKKLDQLIKGGYLLGTGDLIEMGLYGLIVNSILCETIIQKQFELEQLIKRWDC